MNYMDPQAAPDPDADPVAQDLHALLCELRDDVRRRSIPAELRTVVIHGEKGFEHLDDVGAPAMSYGVINPTPIKAYVNFGGGLARAGSAVTVPAQSALVMPIATPGHVNLGFDSAELGQATASLFRLRFHSVQPFFIGAI